MREKRRHIGICKEPPYKRQYRTSLDCLLDHMRNPRTIRAYHCPFCGHFHATSKPRLEAA